MHPHPWPSKYFADFSCKQLLDGPFKDFAFLYRPSSFFQTGMEEKASFICGVTFKTRFPDGEYKILAAPVARVQLAINGGITAGRTGRKQICLNAKVGAKKYPLRFQTTPLILAKKRDIRKGKFQCTVLDFDYLSQLDAEGASRCKTELGTLDEKLIELIDENSKRIWPDEDLEKEEIRSRYEGFTTVRKWTPPPPEPTPAEGFSGLVDAVIEDIDADGMCGKFVCEPKEAKEGKGESKKRKQMDNPVAPKVMEFPAQLSIFPRAKKEALCKITSMAGKPVLLSTLPVGIEAIQVFEIGLMEENGKIKPSCTGLEINLKEDHREPSSFVAKGMFVPTDNED
jgi:hypothetical protein